MAEWPQVPFGSLLAEKPRNGIHKGPQFQGNGTPVVKMGEVYHSERIGVDTARDRFQLTERELGKAKLQAGDLLFCRTSLVADGVGRCAVVGSLGESTVPASNLIRMRMDPARAVPGYWLYYFRSPLGHQHLTSLARGTSVTTITGPDIASIVVRVPPFAHQATLNRILESIDDRMELCRQQASTLEEVAAAMFKSRFIDFDGTGEFGESIHDRIPRGWKAGVISDLGAPVNQKVTADPSAVITLDQMPKQSTVLSDWKEFGGEKSLRSFSEGDVLFGKLRPYFHKVGVAPVDGVCSTEILVLKPTDDAYWGLLLGHASSKAFIEHCVLHSTGTRMPRSEWKDIQAYPIAMPPRDVAEEFASLARTYYARIHALIHQARTLAALRDALLPELVSGALPVPESLLEIYGGEEAPLAS